MSVLLCDFSNHFRGSKIEMEALEAKYLDGSFSPIVEEADVITMSLQCKKIQESVTW